MAKDIISIDRNSAKAFTITLYNDGVLVTSYGTATGDVPSCSVWAGSDQAVVATPTAAWTTDGTDGKITLTFAASDTSSLETGRYSIRVSITTTDSRTVTAWDGYLDVQASPGTAAAPKTYCSYADLKEYYEDLDDLQGDGDLEGLANHRARARTWLEGIIQRHAPRTLSQNRLEAALLSTWGLGDSKLLQDYLDADKLMVKPLVVEITANRALGTFLSSKIGPNDKDSAYQREGQRFLDRADALIGGFVAQIDNNDDGLPEITIRCSTPSFRSIW